MGIQAQMASWTRANLFHRTSDRLRSFHSYDTQNRKEGQTFNPWKGNVPEKEPGYTKQSMCRKKPTKGNTRGGCRVHSLRTIGGPAVLGYNRRPEFHSRQTSSILENQLAKIPPACSGWGKSFVITFFSSVIFRSVSLINILGYVSLVQNYLLNSNNQAPTPVQHGCEGGLCKRITDARLMNTLTPLHVKTWNMVVTCSLSNERWHNLARYGCACMECKAVLSVLWSQRGPQSVSFSANPTIGQKV